jgi:hypothetical protein
LFVPGPSGENASSYAFFATHDVGSPSRSVERITGEAGMMKRRIVVTVLAIVMSGLMGIAQPAAAEGGGCAAFGQNIAFLATNFGRNFGQMASSTAPLNDTVETEQDALCG